MLRIDVLLCNVGFNSLGHSYGKVIGIHFSMYVVHGIKHAEMVYSSESIIMKLLVCLYIGYAGVSSDTVCSLPQFSYSDQICKMP